MKVCWWLTKAMMKSAVDWGQFGNKRKIKAGFLSKLSKPGRVIVGVLFFLYMAYFLGVLQAQKIAPMVQDGLPLSVATAPIFLLSLMFVFMTAIMSALMILIQGDDLPQYFLLPVRRYQIVLARCLVLFVGTPFWVPFMMYLPFGVALCYLTGQPFWIYLTYLYHSLFMTVIPVSIAAILLVLVARIFSFARNKDTMMHITNALVMLFALAFGAGYGFLGVSSGKGSAVTGISIPLYDRLLWTLDSMFYGTRVVILIYFTLISLAFLGVLIFFTQKLLVRLTTGMKSSGHHKVKTKHWKATQKEKSLFWTLLQRENRMIYRSPSFMMNTLASSLLYPILIVIALPFLIPMLLKEMGVNFWQMRDLFHMQIQALEGTPIFSFALIGFVGALFLFGGQISMGALSLSREGPGAQQLKLLPVSENQWFGLKVVYTLLTDIPAFLVIYLGLPIVFGVPWKWTLQIVLISLLVHVLLALWGNGIDWLRPKLEWTNEMYALKQNLNAFFEFGVSLMLGALVCAILYFTMRLGLSFTLLLGLTYVLLALLLVVTVLLMPIMIRRGWRKIS